MRIQKTTRRRGEPGQAMVILTMSVAAVLAMAALVVDGGNAMAQQRETQNGTDAAALAGATVIVQKLAGTPKSDADVHAAVLDAASANGTSVGAAVYVDFNGNVLGTVGAGGPIPAGAYGVRADGNQSFDTFLAGIGGLSNVTTGAQATAMAGALSGVCPASAGCGVMPVAPSIPVRVCDSTNQPLRVGVEWPHVPLETALADTSGQHMSIIPLCTNGPGGVGWLDMSGLGCGGNTLEQWVATPCNESFDLPVWLKTKPGDMNNVESAMNSHRGQVVLIPMFSDTCREPPSSGLPADCTNSGMGNNLWYHIPQFAAFLLHEAYIAGDDRVPCNSAPGQPAGGGNGSTSCIKGWFVKFITSGRVGPPKDCPDPSQPCIDPVMGVQLVR